MFVHDVDLLACPESGHPLQFQGTNLETVLMDGVLVCVETQTAWGVADGWPRLMRDAPRTMERARTDRLENAFPRLHDPLVRLLPQILGGGGVAMRNDLLQLLRLDDVPKNGARILEVGVATGLNLSPLLDAVPAGASVEVWGTDTRVSLLHQCRDRAKDDPRLEQVRLLLASPPALPFPDGTFDRVLWAGGVKGVVNPAAAIAELVRVTSAGGTIVIADERTDSSSGLTGWRRNLLGAIGGTPSTPVPLESLAPDGVSRWGVRALDPVIEVLTVQR